MSYLPGHVRIAIFRQKNGFSKSDCVVNAFLKSGNNCVCVSENSASIKKNKNYVKAKPMSEPFIHDSYFCMDY